MAASMNRRNWLKSSALLAGGLTVFSGSVSPLLARTNHPFRSNLLTDDSVNYLTDEAINLATPPQLKAKLNSNENPFGPSEKAKKAVIEALNTSYQYPHVYIRELVAKIAEYEGVKPENILMGAGSSPLLLASAMHYSKNGGNIISGDPTYASLPRDAQNFNAKWVKVPLTAEHKLDLDAMEKKVDSSTALMYICNPNNPTGTVVDTAKLKAFTERVSKKVPVFIDEAYIDYLPDLQAASLIDSVKKGQNVMVARTFSKLYGFAGLRVGYLVAPAEMVKQLDMYTAGGGSISATSAMAALAAYQDKTFLKDALAKTLASKEFLYSTLKKEGYEYIPSSSNFVMFPLRMEGEKFVAEMMKRGVGVRQWKFAGKDWCRVSIGRLDEMQAFAQAFNQLS